MYQHDKPNEPTKEGPLSYVLFESPFASVSSVSRGPPPHLVSLVKTYCFLDYLLYFVYIIDFFAWFSEKYFLYYFGGLKCVGDTFAFVAHFVFLRDVCIRTQRAAVASRHATNLATRLPLTLPPISLQLKPPISLQLSHPSS